MVNNTIIIEFIRKSKEKGWDSFLYDFDMNEKGRQHYHGYDIALTLILRMNFLKF